MNTKSLRQFCLFLVLFSCGIAWAQAPAGYYDSALNKNKEPLLSALHDIVGPHTTVSYTGLWSVYRTSDRRADGTVWDMYSTSKFTFGSDQCGSYSSIGDCYNREHSFPKSWFGKSSPMVSDAYHIYPTDGKVNGQRSNYPYGETNSGSQVSSHGDVHPLGQLGPCSFPGYSGTVFEPVDEYKGDFARTYFYMAACYKNRISSWNSPMLSNDDYPCYTTWAINLLLKWSRQDPVSDKEINRNNAVSAYQHNRNPFIDYPELAEFIWGDKMSADWQPGGEVVPELSTPVDASSINMGLTATARPLAKVIQVKGANLTEDVTVTVSNATNFSLSAATLTAAQVNTGVDLTVTFSATTATVATTTLTISNANVTSTISLSAQAVEGIPAQPAEDIKPTSFVANWTNVHGAVNYSLSVSDDTGVLPGFPVEVAAVLNAYTVAGLTPSTAYTYQLTYGDVTSNVVEVSTPELEKVISFVAPAGGYDFAAVPGSPSEMKEVVLYTENVTEDVTVTIAAPFEISKDKATWAQSLLLDASGESFYLRLAATSVGSYTAVLNASTTTTEGDEVDVTGISSAPVSFVEDFEAATSGGYYTQEVQGSVANWDFVDAGVWGSSGDRYNGKLAVRFGKSATSSITMLEDKLNGASTLSFQIARYGGDTEGTIDVFYSVDKGDNWTKLGSEVISATTLTEYTYTINTSSPVRLKFAQVDGKRLCLDDVTLSDYVSGVDNALASKTLDAFCANGRLVLESTIDQRVKVYSADAMTLFNEDVAAGTKTITLPRGMYIVVGNDTSKKVIIK
ncbi:MAG: endonuclease [Bacteroidaceae bacterium]|nr:endonuclease [Bacteroidaceae bacterium]